MDDNKKTKLTDDALNEVAGGRTGMDWGSTAQANVVPVVLPPTMPPILVHPDPRSEEDKNANIIPGFTGRL